MAVGFLREVESLLSVLEWVVGFLAEEIFDTTGTYLVFFASSIFGEFLTFSFSPVDGLLELIASSSIFFCC